MVNFEQPSAQHASKPKKKRPASGENVPSAEDRVIQPQLPFNFPSVNSPSDPATDPGVTPSGLGRPPKKKRGRPSKLEHEAKVAEAAARGETYQPTPKRKKTPRPSLHGPQNPGMVTPSMPEVGTVGDGSAGMRNARMPQAGPEEASGLASEPSARSLGLEATALAADHMQIHDRKPFRSTIPETQASEVDAREGLWANIRANAEHTVPDTVHSTMTLQHGSAPQNDFTSYQGQRRDTVTTGEQQML